jgi:hypothetical protein
MKFKNIIAIIGVSVSLFSLALAIPPGMMSAAKPTASQATMGTDTETMIDVNNLQMFVTNQGGFAEDWSLVLETAKNDGLYFPAGTDKTVLYSAGIWVGALVYNPDADSNEIRLAVGAFDTPEYFSGPADDDGVAQDDQARYRVYKIRKDSTAWNNPNKAGIKTNTGTPYIRLDSINHYDDWTVWASDPDVQADGAPLDSMNNPLLLGDQTLWCVFNDGGKHTYNAYGGGTMSLGVELQATFWGYDLPGALGNTIFAKWKVINKGNDTLQETYISLWADPDLGGASDDLVGCDTTLSLGYCYNATNTDSKYGSSPPAIGFDFLQGPLVPSPGDTAILNDGSLYPDMRTLGMESFNKYINGTDPDVPAQGYGYMRGFDAVAQGPDVPYIDPQTGDTTKYFGAGDPVSGKGWIDNNPADRRFMLSTGPFTMYPNDTQVVVAGIVVGQGKDRLSSITAMKFYDNLVQFAYDVNFNIPLPPPRPVVTAEAYDRKVVLTWTNRSEVEYSSETHEFEGYRVYQGETVAGPWKQIATFDIQNGRGALKDFILDPQYGDIIFAPVVFGEDAGLNYSIEIMQDAIKGGRLHNGTDYYFAVTAYSYDFADAAVYSADPGLPDEAFAIPKGLWYLENRPQPEIVTPMDWLPGNNFDHASTESSAEYLQIDTLAPPTTDYIKTRIVDPEKVTGHQYKIVVTDIYPDTVDGVPVWPVTSGLWEDGKQIDFFKYWEIYDNTLDQKLLGRQWSKSGNESNPVLDGIEFSMVGSFKPDGLGIVSYDNVNTAHPDPLTPTATGGSVDWGGAYYGGAVDYGFVFFGSSLADPVDIDPDTIARVYSTVEVRFTGDPATGQRCYDYLRGSNAIDVEYYQCTGYDTLTGLCTLYVDVTDSVEADPDYPYDSMYAPHGNYAYWGYFQCPFIVWDTINDRQLNAGFVEWTGSGVWDSTWDPSSGEDLGGREYLFIFNEDYSGDNPDDAVIDPSPWDSLSISGDASLFPVMYALWPGVDGVIDDGDVLRFSLRQPATNNDYWLVNTVAATFGDKQAAKSALDKIRVVPNPYYAYSLYEADQFDRQVRFLGVPDNYTIRIFNLAGDKVRTLSSSDKVPGNSWAIWNLATDQGLPVAAGIYIWYLEAPGIGTAYGKMAIFPEVEQLNTY